MKKLAYYLFIAGLFITPFIYWPFHEVPFEVPKVFVVNRWIELLVVSGLFLSPTISGKKNVDVRMIAGVILFFIIATISSLFGSDLTKSILGNYYRRDGVITLFHMISLYFFVTIFIKQDWIKPMIKSISLSSIILACWAVVDFLRIALLNSSNVVVWDGAVGVSFGNPNFLAGYLLTTLPLTHYLFTIQRGWYKPLAFIGLILQVFAIAATHSWGGIIGIVLFFFLLLILKNNIRSTYFISTITLLFLVSFVTYKTQVNLVSSDILVAESRARIFTKAYLAFKEKPIIGWGWANFDHAFNSVVWPIKLDYDVYVDKAHSIILEVLVTTGLVGLFTYMFILVKCVYNYSKANLGPYKYLALSLLVFIFHSQTNIISVSEEVLFWILTAIAGRRSLLS